VLAAPRSAASTARKSGHLDSAVDPAALPLKRPSDRSALRLPVSDMRGHASAVNARTRGRTKAGVAVVFTSDVLFATSTSLKCGSSP
jgi:hypothetical protein